LALVTLAQQSALSRPDAARAITECKVRPCPATVQYRKLA